MKVFLREKKMSKGRKSLYLDFYPPIIHPSTGKQTRREFLKLFTIDKPRNEADRVHNKETKILAEKVRTRRQVSVQANNYGFLLPSQKKSDFLQYFKDLADKRKTSKGNYDNWISSYNYFNAFTKGHCLMEDVTERLVSDFKDFLLTTPVIKKTKTLPAENKPLEYGSIKGKPIKKLSQNAAYSYFNKFRAAVKKAFEENYLQQDPLKRIKSIKQAEVEREFLTNEELNLLARTECEIPELKTMALFSALTGLRWSDIVKLKWSELQHSKDNGHYIQFTQRKTKGVEVHPIPEQAAQLLGSAGNYTDKVFPNMVYSAWLNSKLKFWVLKAGINKKITFHSFRHTYATLQITAGTDLYVLSKLLGHREIKTTQIYAKVIDKKKIEAANRIKINFE